MEFGLQLAHMEWAKLKSVAQAAEELGFQALLLPDHFIAEGPERQPNPEAVVHEAMIEAAVLAEATKTVRIGHLVLCNLFRHPALTAQALTSLDGLSNGRLIAGLGTGWMKTEFDMTGIPYPDIGTRIEMLDEALTCIRALWTREKTTFAGKYYQLQDAIHCPKPQQTPHPPILLGGSGKGLLRVAAKHADIVNIISDSGKPGYIALGNVAKLTNDAFRSKIRFLREAAQRHGREANKIQISNAIFSTMVTDSPAATKATAEAMAPMFNTTPEGLLQSPMALIGTPEECTAELRRRIRDWDLSQVIFSNPDESTIQKLAAIVKEATR